MSAINIIFSGPPGPEGPRFVEIEDEQGRSIRIGDWSEYQPEGYEDAGLWKLRISLVDLMGLGATTELPEEC